MFAGLMAGVTWAIHRPSSSQCGWIPGREMMEVLVSVPKCLRTLWKSSKKMAVSAACAGNVKEKQDT